jgi:hypothetical protein
MQQDLWRRGTHKMFGRPEERRPLGKPKLWWVDNIKMDLTEIGWDGMD